MDPAHRPQLNSDDYVDSLVRDLGRSGLDKNAVSATAEKALLNLREAIENPDSYTIVIKEFDLSKLIKMRALDDEHKKQLCQLITQVFIGSTVKPEERQTINETINRLFRNGVNKENTATIQNLSITLSAGRKMPATHITTLVEDPNLARTMASFFPQKLTGRHSSALARSEIYFDSLDPSIAKANNERFTKEIADVPQEELQRILWLIGGLRTRNSSKTYFLNLLAEIRNLKDRSVEIFEVAKSLMTQQIHGYGKEEMINVIHALAELAPQEMKDVAKGTEGVLHDETTAKEVLEILRTIAAIPREQRAAVLSCATPIVMGKDPVRRAASNLDSLPKTENPESVIKAFAAIESVEERAAIARHVQPLADKLRDFSYHTKALPWIIKAFKDVPEGYRGAVVDKIKEWMFLQETEDATVEMIKTTFFILRDHPTDSEEIFDCANRLLEKINAHLFRTTALYDTYAVEVVKTIAAFDPAKRQKCVDSTLNLLNTLGTLDSSNSSFRHHLMDLLSILPSFGDLPLEEHEGIIPQVANFLISLKSADTRAAIEFLRKETTPLEAKSQEPDPETAGVKEVTTILVDNYGPNELKNLTALIAGIPWEEALKVLQAVHNLPKGQHSEIIAQTIEYLFLPSERVWGTTRFILVDESNRLLDQTISASDRVEFLQAIAVLSKDRSSIIACGRILRGRELPYTKDAFMQKLNDAAGLSQEERVLVANRFALYEKRPDLISLIEMIAPEDLPNVWNVLGASPAWKDVPNNELYQNLDKILPGIIERAHANISNMLSIVETDRDKAYALSSKIINSRDALGMYDDDLPVLQRAIAIFTISRPDMQRNRKGPYNIYQKLQSINEPQVPCNAPVVDGLQMDLGKLREMAQTKPLTFGDLPKIDKNLLQNIVNGMKSPAERRVEVERVLGMSVEELETLLFNRDNSIVKKLLQIQLGKSDEPISSDLYYLYKIIDAIAHEPNEKRELPPLSLQEERLVNFVSFLSECSTAQAEALPKYYNLLPGELRERRQQGQEAGIEAIENGIDDAIRNRQEDILENDALLSNLTGVPNPIQGVHQSRYLKNRLHKQIGLKHKVEFDEHSGVLYDNLLDLPVEQLVDPVIAMYTPKEFIQEVRRSFNEMLKSAEGQKMILGIYEYIQTKFPDVDKDTLFEEGEEFGNYTIKEEGAKKLLEARGYLCSRV